ncbi:hypothetical protein, partial [Paenibacillus sp. UASWS1643]|uniref:hypothetical protein n=1 Tax=Paenibacillus sp. UASWS1643 TaxID=2580422 RepID=UPI001CC2DBE4
TSSEGEEGAAGVSLASDFNRQERWEKKSEDKRAPRPCRPRTSAVHAKLAYSSAASLALHGES